MTGYVSVLTRSLREPGVPCAKSMEVSESCMERVNTSQFKFELIFFFYCIIHSSMILKLILRQNCYATPPPKKYA